MENQLKILYVSSELTPFARTGGLGDVSASLPKYVKDSGHDVRVIMPKYKFISDRKYILRDVIRLRDIEVPMGDHVLSTNVKSAFLPNSKVQVYFVYHEDYFQREGIYVDPKTTKDYPDNGERFAFFSKSALEILKTLHWQPDIIHCNDWQTALIPYYLKTIYAEDPFFENTHSLLTLHNLAFQGIFEKKILPFIGIDEKNFDKKNPLEFWGKVNYLKAGILSADLLSTVSKTYAKEIQKSDEFGFGLQDYLRKRKKQLYGIVNGVDYNEWNPETDKFIPEKYSPSDTSGKVKNKKALLEKANLPFSEDIPVLGIISRITEQKGFDLICDALDDLMKLKIQLVILGVGDKKIENCLERAAKKHKTKLALFLEFNNPLSHLIEAGSDFFLMPSRFEPCGLNQIYSLKYGTIPIVRETGGLADTIKDFSEESKRGYGFVFQEPSPKALLAAVKRALGYFQDEDTWKKLVQRAMKQDFSWEKVVPYYINLYEKLL
ncbi:starch synthase [candidate division KSB1 bacterium 4484_87]|nr:MAG: starch synthase [candidate division KSB1 bacterium 4484_87]